MKNVINLQNSYLPGELDQEIARFVDYYNYHRYHESLNNLTPAGVYFGRDKKIVSVMDRIKERTMKLRRVQNLAEGGRKKNLQERKVSLRIQAKLSKILR